MNKERPTLRPVNIARLIELTNLCEEQFRSINDIKSNLDASKRRIKEALLEANRINLIQKSNNSPNEDLYTSTNQGKELIENVIEQDWKNVSKILENGSPHYKEFINKLKKIQPATPKEILKVLEDQEFDVIKFNKTGIDVLKTWGERLGRIQRNVFSNKYYLPTNTLTKKNFSIIVLQVYDTLEEKHGVNLRQRYISVPKLREHVCEKLRIHRSDFNKGIQKLIRNNIGKIEVSGAPLNTLAKDSRYDVKKIQYTTEDSLVTTTQSSSSIRKGIEINSKKYYYICIFDDGINPIQEE